MVSGRPRLVDARRFGARLEALRGEPTQAGGLSVTPIARRLVVWWPGGGWVYAWPTAIEYPEGNQTRRVRIVPVQTLGLAALAALGLAAFVAATTQRWLAVRAKRHRAPR